MLNIDTDTRKCNIDTDTSKLNLFHPDVWRVCIREVHNTQDNTTCDILTGDILTLVLYQFENPKWQDKIGKRFQETLKKFPGVPYRIVVIPSDENQPKVDVDGFVLVFGGSDEFSRNYTFASVRLFSMCFKRNTVCMTRAGVHYDVVSCTPVDHSEPVVPEPVVLENTVGRVEMDVPFNVDFAHLDVPFNVGFDHLDVPFNVGFAFRALQAGVRDMLSPMFDVSHSLVSSLLAPHTTTL